MKCVLLHESERRIRVKIPRINMTCRQADLLEYYLKSLPEISDAAVDERSNNAIVYFQASVPDKLELLNKALADYNEQDEKVITLVPEETGRVLNHEYQEKLLFKTLWHYAFKLFMPLPICTARTILKSIPFAVKAARSLFSGSIKVELLDGVAITASVLRGDYSTASSVMFLLDTGEILEEWTRKKSIGDLARSMSLNVDQVWLKMDDTEMLVPVSNIKVGDRIVLRSSDIIPLDGKVVEGEMFVNQATMTGESEPVHKKSGGYVYAGTVVEEGECIIEAAQEAGSSKYDRIVHMIEESQKLSSEAEAKAYRLADSLVPYSFAGFAVTYALTRNITKALSFLMVDYSCAMKLSMPLAVLSAISEARNHGITVKGGKFMELVAEADTIVFDKTGTLTNAAPELVDIVTFGSCDADEMLRIAACLEEHYPHSVANAIVKGAVDKRLKHDELHTKVEYIVAHGVSSYIDEKKAVIGSRHFVLEDEGCRIPEGEEYRLDEIREEYTCIYLAIDGVLTAVMCILDCVKPEAAKTIEALHSAGIRNICMMTGDNYKTAKAVAKKLGIDEFCAEVLPEDKARYVYSKRAEGHKVIMVGDGVNDSPALSEADVGIAIDTGAAIAREISDISISSENLYELTILRQLSCALMNRIGGNYRFIVGFNSALIVAGIAGAITPAISSLLHNSSTILTGLKSTTKLLP